MIGLANIPDLKLTRLQKLIERFSAPPNLVLMNLFGSDNWESDNIEWESVIGNRGLAPFSAPDSPAASTSPVGVATNAASAAFWQEKMFMSESYLNNMRIPGTTSTYMNAAKHFAKGMSQLSNRNMRRKEWMFAQMINSGSVDYLDKKGVACSYTYSIPDANQVSLAAARHWDTGTERNILEDIMSAKLTLRNSNGSMIDYALFTTEVLNMMILDEGIQTLLTKSAFGNGDLFARPMTVLGSLLDIQNMVLYDEQYQARARLTAAVTADTTVSISVSDASDFVVGEELTFWDVSANTTETSTISAVSEMGGTVTVDTAPTASYKAQEDVVYMTAKFLPSDKFIMFASQLEGQKIAEFANAPFGVDRVWGMKADTWEVKDPDGAYIRIQNKGLPVLYNEDAIYQLTVT